MSCPLDEAIQAQSIWSSKYEIADAEQKFHIKINYVAALYTDIIDRISALVRDNVTLQQTVNQYKTVQCYSDGRIKHLEQHQLNLQKRIKILEKRVGVVGSGDRAREKLTVTTSVVEEEKSNNVTIDPREGDGEKETSMGAASEEEEEQSNNVTIDPQEGDEEKVKLTATTSEGEEDKSNNLIIDPREGDEEKDTSIGATSEEEEGNLNNVTIDPREGEIENSKTEDKENSIIDSSSGVISEGAAKPTTYTATGTNTCKYVPLHMRENHKNDTRYSNSKNIRISNIHRMLAPDDLKKLITKIGPYTKINFPRDKDTQTNAGYAYIRFKEHKHAAKAIFLLNGEDCGGQIFKVEWSRP
ncbi:eukaryotic translation initiation factor 3 subunit G-like [Contarinia nasturtii]|uniref:eukaryotic translation initiation factor 3 subunit G-like n=1 Tax=Contarinia nasturtii TaxID=265458 RepID=UPI0012D41DBA|nr:eukaryotic translation initiation factor 3 subunit G-like [Contarinia nasturtii]